MSDPRSVVETFLEALSRNDADAMKPVLGAYVQHNPNAPTGPEFILEMQPVLKEAGFGLELHRMFHDGPFVVTHITFSNAAALGADTVVVFDIWKVVDGRIDEHWDCIAPLSMNPVGGRTQTDGSFKVTDLHATESNKAVVNDFVSSVLVGGQWALVSTFLRDGLFCQHNPLFDDGLESLVETRRKVTYRKVHRLLGEGNFVLAQCEGEIEAKPFAIYDLFRLDDGKIVEHWDVWQEIPAESANDNGMF
ncbi:MAG: nuclear transport factor 2 family protein [Planctomycetota bacterium]